MKVYVAVDARANRPADFFCLILYHGGVTKYFRPPMAETLDMTASFSAVM